VSVVIPMLHPHANGIRNLDVLWGFRRAAALDPAPLYLTRDTHWNDKGNQLAASLILPWLEGLIAELPGHSSTTLSGAAMGEVRE